MDRNKIEKILSYNPMVVSDAYTIEVAEILRIPAWYHPIKRRAYKKQFINRVNLVLREHSASILDTVG